LVIKQRNCWENKVDLSAVGVQKSRQKTKQTITRPMSLGKWGELKKTGSTPLGKSAKLGGMREYDERNVRRN